MFYMTCKYIVSHNIVHTTGTEMHKFCKIQNSENVISVPVGCNYEFVNWDNNRSPCHV